MRKKLAAIVLAVLAFSMIAASAASLGGITTAQMGAETDVVAGCDPDGIIVDFTVAFSGGEYKTSTVDITEIDSPNCDGQDIAVTLVDGSGATLGSASASLGAGQTSYSAAISASASAVAGIAVVIEG